MPTNDVVPVLILMTELEVLGVFSVTNNKVFLRFKIWHSANSFPGKKNPTEKIKVVMFVTYLRPENYV